MALSLNEYLAAIQIVMVNTTLPANIGSAARAMHTMGLSKLIVVDPKLPIDDTSEAYAAGGIDILTQAKICPTLDDAIQDCQLVFAASSRSRHLPRPVVNPSQAAALIANFIDTQPSKTVPNIAILFGREDRGLTNDELATADYHIQIDANPDYPVLNVASAIQVIASFVFTYLQSHVTNKADNPQHESSPTIQTLQRQHWDEPAISQSQLQQLTQNITKLMVTRKLADPDHLRALPSRLSRLSSRLQLDQKEYQLLSALIAKLLKESP
ncbi:MULTISPECIES: RNA methyltransferase [Psychrobacter]|uniref:RNA methyltransferase n=1 Tax=Psychrobacter TaxID=497 RepID=UPI00146C5DD4|nr:MULTISPECIES: RNA methyltransferase [Psychrobacter]